MKSGIYKITNNLTGKCYIGSSKDIDKRWYDHTRELNLNIHTNPKMQHSWNYYGGHEFTFLLLEEVEPLQEKLFEREQYYLDLIKPYIRGMGYNISPTAIGGDNITHHPDRDAFIQKMSDISSGEGNPMFGEKHSAEAIQKQKTKAIGRYTLEWFVSRYGKPDGQIKFDERRSKMSNRPKECFSHPNPTKGIPRPPMSPEAKALITQSKIRMKSLKKDLLKDLKSDKFTVDYLSEKYKVVTSTIKYYKRKLRNENTMAC